MSKCEVLVYIDDILVCESPHEYSKEHFARFEYWNHEGVKTSGSIQWDVEEVVNDG